MALCGLLLTAAVIAVLIEMRTAERQKRKTYLLHVVFPCLLVLLLYIRASDPLFVLRGMALIFCLYTASLQDLYNREVDDCLWVMVLLSALIRFKPAEIPIMLAGMFMSTLPLFAASVLKNGSIGGADIKLMAAVGFFFGPRLGLTSLIIGLTASVVGVCITRKIKKEPVNTSFPLVPFLAAGSFAACLL